MTIMNNPRNNLGSILKQQRQSASLTLYELSAASGVSPSYLGRIENGERFPSADILQKLARPLGFGEAELFSLAGYLTAKTLTAEAYPQYHLDPSVARFLSQEPLDVQRAVVGILSILKSLSVDMHTPDHTS